MRHVIPGNGVTHIQDAQTIRKRNPDGEIPFPLRRPFFFISPPSAPSPTGVSIATRFFVCRPKPMCSGVKTINKGGHS